MSIVCGYVHYYKMLIPTTLLQVFAVRGKGALGVVVKGPDEKSVANFR
jgi:hypothetical protein